ncbi:MAG: ferredoxin [Bdellovibrio sp.]|nr:MAG: ferredoxin [Bdellovibrio sp.]
MNCKAEFLNSVAKAIQATAPAKEKRIIMKAHLFICTNSPHKEGKCGHRGSERLRQSLKQRCRQEFGDSGEYRVNSSGCLGPCENGINAVLYPEGRWFHHLTPDDVDSLFEAMKVAMSPNAGSESGNVK